MRGARGAGRRAAAGGPVIPMRSGVRVWLATGRTDMRKGVQGLALLVQEDLKRDPHVGDLSSFVDGADR